MSITEQAPTTLMTILADSKAYATWYRKAQSSQSTTPPKLEEPTFLPGSLVTFTTNHGNFNFGETGTVYTGRIDRIDPIAERITINVCTDKFLSNMRSVGIPIANLTYIEKLEEEDVPINWCAHTPLLTMSPINFTNLDYSSTDDENN